MPTLDTPVRTPRSSRPSAKYEGLTPLEAALVDQIGQGNENVVEAVNKLAARAPHPALVWSIGGAILVYVVSLVALGRGIDPAPAAEATKAVIEAAVIEELPPVPPEAPPAKDETPAAPVPSDG